MTLAAAPKNGRDRANRRGAGRRADTPREPARSAARCGRLVRSEAGAPQYDAAPRRVRIAFSVANEVHRRSSRPSSRERELRFFVVANLCSYFPTTWRREDQGARLKARLAVLAITAADIASQRRRISVEPAATDLQPSSRSALPPELHPERVVARDKAATTGPKDHGPVWP